MYRYTLSQSSVLPISNIRNLGSIDTQTRLRHDKRTGPNWNWSEPDPGEPEPARIRTGLRAQPILGLPIQLDKPKGKLAGRNFPASRLASWGYKTREYRTTTIIGSCAQSPLCVQAPHSWDHELLASLSAGKYPASEFDFEGGIMLDVF